MTTGYCCPKCGHVNVIPIGHDRSFLCVCCRTAVALIDDVTCYYGSLDDSAPPIRSAIEGG